MEQILQYEIFQIYQALLSINFVQRVSIFGKEECQFDYIKDVHFDIHVPTFCRMEKKKNSLYMLLVNIVVKISQDQTGNVWVKVMGWSTMYQVPSYVLSIEK